MKKRIAIGALALVAAAGLGAWLYRRYGPSTYLRFDTMFGRARVYQVLDDDGSPVRLLEVGGVVHSGTYLDERRYDLVFEYLKRYDLMFEAGRSIGRVCVLGCGGYDYPEHLIAHHPSVAVDAVEIDPAITAIARRWFFLDRLIEEHETEKTGRLNLVCDDALSHLLTTNLCYDAIVNDTFDAGKPPAHLTTREFVQAAFNQLNPGGVYLTNIVAPLEGAGRDFLDEQVSLMEAVFGNARIVPCATGEFAEEDNVIAIAEKPSW